MTEFTVGSLEYPRERDKRFDNLEDAEERAQINSIDGNAWAVREDCELVSIVYQQIIYRP